MWPFTSKKKEEFEEAIKLEAAKNHRDEVTEYLKLLNGASIEIDVSKPHTDILDVLDNLTEKVNAFISPTIYAEMTASNYIVKLDELTRQTISTYIVNSFDLSSSYKFSVKIGRISVYNHPIVCTILRVDLDLQLENSFDPPYKPPFEVKVRPVV